MFSIFIILLFYKKSINLFPHILILKISVLKYNKLLYLNMIFKYEKINIKICYTVIQKKLILKYEKLLY